MLFTHLKFSSGDEGPKWDEELRERLLEGAADFAREGAGLIADAAPVSSGLMANNVKGEVIGKGGSEGLYINFGVADVPYAPYIEFGIAPVAAPFSRIEEYVSIKEGYAVGTRANRVAAGAIWSAIRRRGIRAHYFARDAILSIAGQLGDFVFKRG